MTNANDPVTPHLTYNTTSGHANGFMKGLTKREHFAAMAMQGILSNSEGWDNTGTHLRYVSNMATKYADALIEALNKPLPNQQP